MVNICIPVRDPPKQDLQLGNLRSESRWERQAIEACIQNPEVKNIFTWGYEWQGGSNVTPKYGGKISRTNGEHCILLMQDWNTRIATSYPWKGIIANIFHGPWLEQIPEIKNLVSVYQNKLAFTVGYPSLFNNPLAREHLLKFLSSENIISLPVPGIPNNRFQSNFQNNTITWAWRIIAVNTLLKAPGIIWALNQLQQDASLNLFILTGWEKNEVKEVMDNGEVIKINSDLSTYLWSQPEMQEFLDVRNRCIVEYALDWREVMNLYGRTKVLLNYSKQLGGPPLEAAMYGLPFVGTSYEEGVICQCPDYLVANNEQEYIQLLNQLLTDQDFYDTTAVSYNNFAVNMYSYESFNNNLNSILKERNLL